MGAIPTVPVECVKNELPAPTFCNNLVLVATVAQTGTKPAGTHWLWINNTDTVYVRFDGGTAVVPSGTPPQDGTGSVPLLAGNGLLFNWEPAALDFAGGVPSVSVVSAGTPVVGLQWYADVGGR